MRLQPAGGTPILAFESAALYLRPRMSTLLTAAFYKFVELPDFAALRSPLAALCEERAIKGTILLAAEGINGTIAGQPHDVHAVLAWLRRDPRLASLEHKESGAVRQPFYRMKVRLKREIVTMGQPEVDPRARVGAYVSPADWNALILGPDVAVIDTRNDYEVAIGTFAGAIDPDIRTFRDFPAWWHANKDTYKGKRIAMFCTGGIRCEKSTNFLIGEGVPEVFHLKGGILKYLEDVPKDESLWQGACFVFDQRVSVTHGLTTGGHVTCFACRRPLEPDDRMRPEYEEGARCHHCVDEYSETQRAGFRERHRQRQRAVSSGV